LFIQQLTNIFEKANTNFATEKMCLQETPIFQ